MNAAEELLQVIRNVAADTVRPPRIALWGYVFAYNPTNHAVQVQLPEYEHPATPGSPLITGWMPLGTPLAGSNYGIRFAPEQGTPCVVLFVGRSSGDACAAFCLFSDVVAGPGTTLTPGQVELVGKGQERILLDGSGNVVFQHGTTPVAVEGSQTAGHSHDLSAMVSAVNTACKNVAGYSSIPTTPPTLTGSQTDTIATGWGAQDVLAPGPKGK